MFASDGTSEAKKNMGPESEGHVAYCSMVGQDGELLIELAYSGDQGLD